jgi:HK97 family phage prohead protease
VSDLTTIYRRALPAVIDGYTEGVLSGRLVPYDSIAHVLDFDASGKASIYQEGFRRGAFDGQVVNGRTNKGIYTRIGLVHRHEGGMGYLGPFTALRSGDDGLYGDVKIVSSLRQDVADLIDAGVDELSVEFKLRAAPNTNIDDAGVRWRTSVHLVGVALEPKGAYSNAEVLAYRSEMDEQAREAAEADAAEEAERIAAQEAERHGADELEAEKRAAEEAAEHLAYLRTQWEAIDARFDEVQRRQGELVREYGVMKPTGWGSVNR